MFIGQSLTLVAQEINIVQVDIFSELPVNKAFPPGNDLITFNQGRTYILHSNRRPLGMEYDSLDLFVVEEGKLRHLQYLPVPSTLQVSKLTGFGVSDSALYFTDYNVVCLFEWYNGEFIFDRYVEAVNLRTVTDGEYGRFEVWHETEKCIYSTDFHLDDSTEGGCKSMFVGRIDYGSFRLSDSFHIPICGNALLQLDGMYPLAFNPSGKCLAAVDIPLNTLSVYRMDQDDPILLYQLSLSDSLWNGMMADSVSHWTSLMESGDRRLWETGWLNLNRHVRLSDRVLGLHFLNDSLVLLRIERQAKIVFRLLNIHTREICDLKFPDQLSEIKWYNHAVRVQDGYVFLLTPNRVEQMIEAEWVELGKPATTLQGFRLYTLSVQYP